MTTSALAAAGRGAPDRRAGRGPQDGRTQGGPVDRRAPGPRLVRLHPRAGIASALRSSCARNTEETPRALDGCSRTGARRRGASPVPRRRGRATVRLGVTPCADPGGTCRAIERCRCTPISAPMICAGYARAPPPGLRMRPPAWRMRSRRRFTAEAARRCTRASLRRWLVRRPEGGRSPAASGPPPRRRSAAPASSPRRGRSSRGRSTTRRPSSGSAASACDRSATGACSTSWRTTSSAARPAPAPTRPGSRSWRRCAGATRPAGTCPTRRRGSCKAANPSSSPRSRSTGSSSASSAAAAASPCRSAPAGRRSACSPCARPRPAAMAGRTSSSRRRWRVARRWRSTTRLYREVQRADHLLHNAANFTPAGEA
jgi:hypothetical protein